MGRDGCGKDGAETRKLHRHAELCEWRRGDPGARSWTSHLLRQVDSVGDGKETHGPGARQPAQLGLPGEGGISAALVYVIITGACIYREVANIAV